MRMGDRSADGHGDRRCRRGQETPRRPVVEDQPESLGPTFSKGQPSGSHERSPSRKSAERRTAAFSVDAEETSARHGSGALWYEIKRFSEKKVAFLEDVGLRLGGRARPGGKPGESGCHAENSGNLRPFYLGRKRRRWR